MERATGIGGVFFRARDPEALSAWYEQHLGITGMVEDGEGEAWWLDAFSADWLNLRLRLCTTWR